MTWISRLFGGRREDSKTKTEHGGRATSERGGTEKAKDPVCGMEVDPAKATTKSEYKGQTYYFCSLGCKRAFDQDPERYIQAEKAGLSHGHH